MKRRTYPVGKAGKSPYARYNKREYKYPWSVEGIRALVIEAKRLGCATRDVALARIKERSA